jgi:hypothetical protein
VAKNTEVMMFAVLLALSGSLTIGDTRLVPFQAAAVPQELADKVDTDVNPVRFYGTQEEAEAAVAKLKADAAAKAKPR